MEINVDAYLKNFENLHKDYKRNDLHSNQEWLARMLQYIYVVGERANAKVEKEHQSLITMLAYSKLIVMGKVPKYREDEIKECLDNYKNKLVYTDEQFRFTPKTFGEMEYVDYFMNHDKDKNRWFTNYAIRVHTEANEFKAIKEKYGIKNITELESLIKKAKGEQK